MEILENIISNQLFTFVILGYILCTIESIIFSIIDYISERAWSVRDYEKIIADNLGTYDSDDNKEKMLIANAKRNTERRMKCLEKRKAIKEKIKRLFSKGKKNDR